MNANKLNQIIDQKNEQLEREALGRADDLISEIARKQGKIITIEAEIADLRKQLAALDITQLDPKVILGE